jgi:hypothetical protein
VGAVKAATARTAARAKADKLGKECVGIMFLDGIKFSYKPLGAVKRHCSNPMKASTGSRRWNLAINANPLLQLRQVS